MVLLGPPGVGKTHLAIALAVKVIEAGSRVYFINATDVARKLAEATERKHLPRLIRNLTKIRLLILDEIGYLELSKAQANLLLDYLPSLRGPFAHHPHFQQSLRRLGRCFRR